MQGAGGIGGLIASLGGLGNVRYYLYDGNGNVGQVAEPDGTIAARYEYDPFGNEIVAEGDEADTNVFRFSTKFFDIETGLVYFGYRYYLPEVGRWNRRDPIGEEDCLNLYGYVNNGPVDKKDMLGLLRAVFYDDDFETQAKAQVEKWKKDYKGTCERFMLFHVESIDGFRSAINVMNFFISLEHKIDRQLNEWVLMFHGSPAFLTLGEGDGLPGLETLSANYERITPRGLDAFPISYLPDIKFGSNSVIRLNSCRGGGWYFPIEKEYWGMFEEYSPNWGLYEGRMNLAAAFNQRYNVNTYAYVYWVKYLNKHSYIVIPSVKSYIYFPIFNMKMYKPTESHDFNEKFLEPVLYEKR